MLELLATILAAIRLLLALAVPMETDHHHHPIQEDSPLWNCQTMGNLICGEWNEQTNTFDLVYYGTETE